MPAGPVEKPVEQWSLGEILTDRARLGMLRLREFVSRSADEDLSDPPVAEQRLILEASATVAKLFAHVQMEALRVRADGRAIEELTRMADAVETQLYGPTKKTAECQRAKAAERAAKEPAK